jgi:hypothetical protein
LGHRCIMKQRNLCRNLARHHVNISVVWYLQSFVDVNGLDQAIHPADSASSERHTLSN